MVELTQEYTDLFKSMDENLQKQTSFLDSMFDMQRQNFLFQKEMARDSKRNAALALEEQQKKYNEQQNQQTQISTSANNGSSSGGEIFGAPGFGAGLGNFLGAGIAGMGVGALAKTLLRRGLPGMLAGPVSDFVGGATEQALLEAGFTPEQAQRTGEIADTATMSGMIAMMLKRRLALPAAIAGGMYEWISGFTNEDGNIELPGGAEVSGEVVAGTAAAAAGATALYAQQKALTSVGAATQALRERLRGTTTTAPDADVDANDPRGRNQQPKIEPPLTATPDAPDADARAAAADLETRAQITDSINRMEGAQRATLNQLAADADLRFASDGSLRNADGRPLSNAALRDLVEAARTPPVLRAPTVDSLPNVDVTPVRIPDADLTARRAVDAAETTASTAADLARASARAGSKALGPAAVAAEAAFAISDAGQVAADLREEGEEQSVIGNVTELTAAVAGGFGDLISLADNSTNKGLNWLFGTELRTDRDLGGQLRGGIRDIGYGAGELTGLDQFQSEALNTGVIAAGEQVDAAIGAVVDAFTDDSADPYSQYAGYSEYGAQLAAEYNGTLERQTETMDELTQQMANYMGAGMGSNPVVNAPSSTTNNQQQIDQSTTIVTVAKPEDALAGTPR